ncbi:NADH-quinone oxidoreductase subunit N [Planctomicrobium piriforme]|uniref:NADH-quinone oxidoreductase subunit N n=1 Tax=Planctomicrobium piriforme TaxID=1576369 RepID=A0A1I3QQ98_9PLAN|nr:NADH-quinone oxidoreductase subunit N [Planctomicrobium piriforme]SFJ36314.1 NADH-quinone oxidoreductase subunit N [Planctomicrobium piriforme]
MTAIDRINAAAGLIVPEIILLATVCIMFLVGPFLVTESGKAQHGLRQRWGALSLLAIGCSMLAWYGMVPQPDAMGPFQSDAFVWFVRGTTLFVGLLLVLMLWNQIDDGHAAEAHACLLAILAGVNLTAAANDLAGLFLGLELVSIPTYVLLYLPRRDRAMREATIKYFLLSIFSAGTFLYGVAWLFGAAGTTNMVGIAEAAKAGKLAAAPGLIMLAQVLIIAGLGFRITAVPFHFYAPDVFQGVTSSSAAMLSFIPKIAGFVGLFRLLPLTQGLITWQDWVPSEPIRMLLATLAVLTMFGGNLLALRQKNLHRLLAYSSVAHAGYMLTGLTIGAAVGFGDGLTALLFYLVIYAIMTLGVFAVLAGAGSNEHPVVNDSDLAGLSKTRPVMAASLALLLFSLTGLPPTAGMLGKLFLFLAAWNEGSTLGQTLAIVLALNAAISAAYYLRLVGVMYLEAPKETTPETSQQYPVWIASAGCVVLMVALFVAPQYLWDAALRATH